MIGILPAAGSAALAAATAISEKRGVHWWLRYFDFPRLQILGAAALLMPVAGTRTRGKLRGALMGTLGGVIGWQAFRIRRFTRLASWQSLPATRHDPARRCRILISNVWMPNRNARGLLDIIRDADPDIIILVETDQWWAEQMRELDAAYPNALRRPLDNTYGMLVYSRLPWSDARLRALLLKDIPSAAASIHLPSGDTFDLYVVHPLPPAVSQDTTHRDADLVLIGKEVKRGGRPAVVAGDLNDVAWSFTTRLFQRISGTLDPRIGRGMFNSYNARWPLLRWPLDHVFHTEDFRLATLQRLPKYGSDHFPIMVELSYEPKRGKAQEEPEMEPGDREIARRKLGKARESGML